MDLIDVIESIADATSTVDPTNAQQVLGKFAALSGDINQKKYVQAKRMWEIGCLLLYNKTTLTAVDLAKYFNMHREELMWAKSVARILDGDTQKFEEKYREMGTPTWWQFRTHYYPQTKTIRKRKQNLMERVQLLINQIRVDPNDKLALEDLNAVQKKIARFLPIKKQLEDMNYLPYSECACCGEYNPPPGGHNLIRYKSEQFMVPRCTECESIDAKPNPEVVAKLYAHYAFNLEYLMSKIEDV